MHFGEQLLRQFERFLFLHAADLARAERHVFQGGEIGEEVELLEHHAGFPANAADVGGGAVDAGAVDEQIPIVNGFERVDATQERRFSGTGRADHHDHLALFDGQGDLVEDGDVSEFLGD